MKYTVVIKAKNGAPIEETPGYTYSQAKKAAKAAATEHKDALVFVTWFRASDQQHGYLNRDGNHAITGEAW